MGLQESKNAFQRQNFHSNFLWNAIPERVSAIPDVKELS